MNVTQWNWSRSLTTDARGGLHAVWVQLSTASIEYPADRPDPLDTTRLPPGQIMYEQSLDGGRTWTTEAALTSRDVGIDSAGVATSGSSVYVIWRAVDMGRLRVFLRRSDDRGVSWNAPVPVSDNPPGVSASPPAVAAWASGSDGSVYVVWADGRPQTVNGAVATTKEVYVARSTDRGDTWTPGRPVSVPDGFSSWTPAVAVWGDAVHVAWTDERDDISECTVSGACHEEEYYRRSLDGGQTWGPERRLTSDPPGNPAESWAPSIAVWQDTVHLAFFDKRSGRFQVYYKRSTDGGVTWGDDVLSGSQRGGILSVRPSIAAWEGTVHLAWFEFVDFEADIFRRASSDDGATWSPALNLTPNAPGAARLPSVTVTPDHATHVIWYDTRNSDANGPRVEIYYARP